MSVCLSVGRCEPRLSKIRKVEEQNKIVLLVDLKIQILLFYFILIANIVLKFDML